MARTGMTTLIETVRGFCNLGTDDYTVGTATYWSDDHIQTVLDRHKLTITEEELLEVPNLVGSGSTEYKVFHSYHGNYEQTTGGTSIFTIENSGGTILGTSLYSADYANGIITFDADQQGSSRYVNGYSYNLNAAAADVWRMKAGAYAESVSWKTDNMSINRSDAIKQCFQMADMYQRDAGAKVVDMIRDDSC